MGRQAPAGLLGIHTNFPAVITAEVGAALGGDKSALAALSEKERAAVERPGSVRRQRGPGLPGDDGRAAAGRRLRPDGLPRRPRGVDARALRVRRNGRYGKDPKQSPTRDDVLDNFSLYWLTNTAASSARIYWENRGRNLISAGDQKTGEIKVPVAITVFPGRGLSRPGGLGQARLPQPDLLPRSRPGRPLRHVGAPGAVCRRTPCRLPITAGRAVITSTCIGIRGVS